jgi:hypothetical protein
VEFGGELGELNKATAAAAAVKTTEESIQSGY